MSISGRNPSKDRVAIASAATTGLSRSAGAVTPGSLAVEAAVAAMEAAGVDRRDVDGIIGGPMAGTDAPANNAYVQAALGIPEVSYFTFQSSSFGYSMINAVAAVASGQCEVLLLFESAYRRPSLSRSIPNDPFRVAAARAGGAHSGDGFGPDTHRFWHGYVAWASRYLHEHHETRDLLGYIAVNGRSNATRNPAAAMRQPLSMDDYMQARMIEWPLCLLDYDLPVDGADAYIITTAERARDMALPAVLVHASLNVQISPNEEEQMPGLDRHGHHVAVQALRAKSDLWLDDMDLFYFYDGFSPITLNLIEISGLCGPGEARQFIEEHWDKDQQRLLINGRIPLNSHGGDLSEGETLGSGHVREAVHQIQGLADDRQVAGATNAMVLLGGYVFNAEGIVLRRQ
jgi:acetyl-CoA acetyltransferase